MKNSSSNNKQQSKKKKGCGILVRFRGGFSFLVYFNANVSSTCLIIFVNFFHKAIESMNVSDHS